MAGGSDLVLEFVGAERQLTNDETLRFGRAADLVIDEQNPHLHRELGEFRFANGQWWLRNVGRSIPLRLWTADQNSRAVLMSGSETALAAAATTIEFEAGRSRYELTALLTPEDSAVQTTDESDTISARDLPLTLSQKQLIVSLAERALLHPGSAVSVPVSKEAAERLGWPMTKFNAKLQNVCQKFAGLGVRGLSSDVGSAAMDRRLRLVEYCIFNKVITAEDLWVLDVDD